MQIEFADMATLKRGTIANLDENRMVWRHWLRNLALAPTSELSEEIDGRVLIFKDFTVQVHVGITGGVGGAVRESSSQGRPWPCIRARFQIQAVGNMRVKTNGLPDFRLNRSTKNSIWKKMV